MRTRDITFTALFVSLGIILPQVFHMFGGPGLGSIFLPMHIPVLIGAMVLGPISGMIIGMLSVLTGFSLGMPALPMAAFMFFELSVYGLVAGYLGNTRGLNPYIALVGAMISGRIVSLTAMRFAIAFLGIKLPPIFGMVAIFAAGLPGVLLQLVIIPPLVYAIRRFLNNGQSIGTT